MTSHAGAEIQGPFRGLCHFNKDDALRGPVMACEGRYRKRAATLPGEIALLRTRYNG